jgi:hypothetical protein
MTTQTAILASLVVLIAAAILTIAATATRRKSHLRTAALRQRFGPEYDRAVEELGTPARAERELVARARRVEHIRVRDLNDADRARFASAWTRIQAQFVDDPGAAVVAANELIKEVMRSRGYPSEDFDHRVADLSVDHAAVVQHYRAARALSESSRTGRVDTEELRQAVVHYRALFADLLVEPKLPAASLHEAHA